MLKRSLILLTMAGLVMTAASCIFDPPKDDGDDDKPIQMYENLSQRWHVLNNLELSYSNRNMTRYEELLDANFTFFFSEGDVGGDIPEQWDRPAEIEANTRLFDANLNDPNFPRAKSIKMDLKNEKTVTWVSIIPEQFPDETWYTANVFYDFQIDVEPDITYIPLPGAKGQFTVRNTGTDAAPKWKLVEFRDLGGQ